jgi:hypothetical protein
LPAKIVVNSVKGGSRISLLGSSGKELLGSVVFKEPRAKGATLRALKGLLGETTVEDHTIKGPQRAAAASPVSAPLAAVPVVVETPAAETAPTPKRKSATKKAATKKTSPAKITAAKVTAAKVTAPKVAAARKSTKGATARP